MTDHSWLDEQLRRPSSGGASGAAASAVEASGARAAAP